MLVLSRKKNESIVINNDITITVVEIRGDKVRLGIVAPKDVPVHRQEVYDAIHAANGPSAPAPPPPSAAAPPAGTVPPRGSPRPPPSPPPPPAPPAAAARSPATSNSS